MDDLDRVVGIDFSAAKRAAGRRTWLAEARVGDGTLELEGLEDAAGRLGCEPSRAGTLEALVEYVVGLDDASVVGLDVPFSLPAALLDSDWHAFVDGTPDRWGRLDSVDSPRGLYDAATRCADEEGAGLLRATDRRHGGQAPTGFRIKTQTYYGVSRVLKGIHRDVAVAPFDETAGAERVVVEAYPAACFDGLDANRTGYKRDTRAAVEARRENVAALARAGVDFGDHRDVAVASDHALDAVAAAVTAWAAATDGFAVDEGTDSATLEREGHIYAAGRR